MDHKQALLEQGWTERDGGLFPPPEIDWEAYREALKAGHIQAGWSYSDRAAVLQGSVRFGLGFASAMPVTDEMADAAYNVWFDTCCHMDREFARAMVGTALKAVRP